MALAMTCDIRVCMQRQSSARSIWPCGILPGKQRTNPFYNLLVVNTTRNLGHTYMPSAGLVEHPERAGEVAAKLLEEGNSACKIDPFMPLFPIRDIPIWEIENAAKIFESIRDTVGNQLEVGIGTHGQLTTYSAIRVADFLNPIIRSGLKNR